jgi:hypothetical protein
MYYDIFHLQIQFQLTDYHHTPALVIKNSTIYVHILMGSYLTPISDLEFRCRHYIQNTPLKNLTSSEKLFFPFFTAE